MSEMEAMIGRLLDRKLSGVLEPAGQAGQAGKAATDGLYRRKEAASMLQVSLVTLDAWTKAGFIKARRLGGRVYYTDKDINDALKRVAR